MRNSTVAFAYFGLKLGLADSVCAVHACKIFQSRCHANQQISKRASAWEEKHGRGESNQVLMSVKRMLHHGQIVLQYTTSCVYMCLFVCTDSLQSTESRDPIYAVLIVPAVYTSYVVDSSW